MDVSPPMMRHGSKNPAGRQGRRKYSHTPMDGAILMDDGPQVGGEQRNRGRHPLYPEDTL